MKLIWFLKMEKRLYYCEEYNKAFGEGIVDPLILIPNFILDFLCIHPFNDGNGRMSRLLTLLLLYRAGYIVVFYRAIENLNPEYHLQQKQERRPVLTTL